jgi:hypothetical protein
VGVGSLHLCPLRLRGTLAVMLAAAERLPNLLVARRAAWESGRVSRHAV